MGTITIRTKQLNFCIAEGKPVMVRWKCKNKQRQGVSSGIGWIRRGEKPHTIELVHQAFSTWDQVENEYASKWTIWESQILDIRQMKRV